MCASPEGRKHGVSKGRVANSCPLTYNSIVVCKYLPSVCARLALLGFPRAIVIYSAHICLYMNGLEKCILLIIGHSDDIGVSERDTSIRRSIPSLEMIVHPRACVNVG